MLRPGAKGQWSVGPDAGISGHGELPIRPYWLLLLLLLKLRQVLRAGGLGTNDRGGRPLFRLRRVYGRYRHPHAELTFRLACVYSPCGRDIRIIPSKCHANMAIAAPQTFTRFYLDAAGSRQFTGMTARRRGSACIAFRRRGFLRAGDWPARGRGKWCRDCRRREDCRLC
jgi:hypothetical protein